MMPSDSATGRSPADESDSSNPPPLCVPPKLAPEVSERASDEPMESVFAGRLHPFTLVLVLVKSIQGFLIPAIVLLAVGSRVGMGLMLLFFLFVTLIQAVTRYFTFSYRIENGELITRQGIIEKSERHIPLARVQDLRLEQGLIHRLLGVVDLLVETAGGQGVEASLSVLSRQEAQRVRAAIFEQARRHGRAEQAQRLDAGAAAPSEMIRQVTLGELVLGGITSNYTASAVLLLAATLQFADDVLPQAIYERTFKTIIETMKDWWGAAGGFKAALLLLGAAAIVLIGTIFSVIGSVVLFHGFTLSRRGEDLSRQYGLLTQRSSNLPRRRIQVLQIQESLLRRVFGLATFRADTAGNRSPQENQRSEGRDVLLPVVSATEIPRLLSVFFPGIEMEPPDWQRVSRRAIRRETFKSAVVIGLLAVATSIWQPGWAGLWPLLFLPAAYGLALVNFRHLGFALTDHYFWTRRGWLSRGTHAVPIRNIQSVLVRQTPLDRRHGVATLIVDTAGQTYTGGGPQIRNVPWEKAGELARLLSRRAAAARYRW